jgi:DNA mismatch endonuclease (patch repair protein)
MENTRRRDTRPEVLLRSSLHRLGLRFRVDVAPIPGMRSRADIIFKRARVAVFVNGCFWHGCPLHATWPKANANWWRAKIEANRARDTRVDASLREAGWFVLRIWEHEELERSAVFIANEVHSRLHVSRPRRLR